MALSRASIRSTPKTCGVFAPLIVSLLGATLACRAAAADEPRLEGVFVNRSSSEEPIRAAIEEATKDFNFITRPIARSRLKKTNPLIGRIEVGRNGDLVSIRLDRGKPTLTEPGKGAVKWTRDDGEVFDVSTEWQGNALNQSFVAPDGKRANRFSISPDGSTLTLDVTLTSPQLKSPVKYRLIFSRAPDP